MPCFLVCNQQGSPYLVPLETGFDVGVVFLDPTDAEEMMQSMVQVRQMRYDDHVYEKPLGTL